MKKIAAMAEAHYVVVAPHNPMGPVANVVNTQFAASTPNFLILEYTPDDSPPRRDLVREALGRPKGLPAIPEKPGWGIELNEEAFRHYPPKPWQRGFGFRADGSVDFIDDRGRRPLFATTILSFLVPLLGRTALVVGEVPRGVHQGDVRERLGEVAEQTLASGSYSSASRPTSLRIARSRSKTSRASSRRPWSARLSASQNVQGRNTPSPAAGRRRSSPNRNAGRTRRPSAAPGSPRPSRPSAGRRPAGSRPAGSSAGWRRGALSRTTARTCSASGSKPFRRPRVDLVAGRLPALEMIGREAELLDRLDRAVEGDPGHDLRVGEVAPAAAHLPDPLVGLLPGRLEEVKQICPAARRRRAAQAVAVGLVEGVEDLAVDVELELPDAALPTRTGFEPS